MRFHKEDFFEMDLYPIPKGVELFDDSLYYVDKGDGSPFVEYYGHYSPENYDLYQPEETWEETMEFYAEQYKVDKELLENLKNPKWMKKFKAAFNI